MRKSTRLKTKTSFPANVHTTYLFETAWEICNPVGGIYTVIRSKIPAVLKLWPHDQYCLLGPYLKEQAEPEFEPVADANDPIADAVRTMNETGYDVKYGIWLVTGRPRVVLFNPFHIFSRLGAIKYEYWEHHHISVDDSDLTNKIMSFGFQIKEFLHLVSSGPIADRYPIVAHFHEWMAGTPIPELRYLNSKVRIVFTTHATLLGRFLAMTDVNFYSNLPYYHWADESKRLNIEAAANIERAAAHGAHVLTTVSELTGLECKRFLGREPEVILPNGLNIKRFEALHEHQNLHVKYKGMIHEFVMGHFFPSYAFDLDKTLYFFTSGRFEFHNKGFNMTLEALARLNWRLKAENTDATVVVFFITQQPYSSINADVLNSRIMTEEVMHACAELLSGLSKRLFLALTSDPQQRFPSLNSLIGEHLQLRIRPMMQSWKSKRLPSVVTHNMTNDGGDEILQFLRAADLVNKKEDKVKIVYHPDFLSQTNPLFRMDYGQFVRGCNLGVFPSYYEPWGYTPLECLASAIPAVTSDLSGFGNYVVKNIPDHEDSGILIVRRRDRSFLDAAADLADIMFDFANMSLRDRIDLRNRSEAASVFFDWDELIEHYLVAYHQVLKA